LEDRFEARVLEEAGPGLPCTDVAAALYEVIGAAGGPSLSSFVAERGTLAQVREFAIHHSAYQLKEADPHTWAIPRLAGAVKAAMVEIQADEYGDGVERDMHQTLFGVTMRALGLDVRYGAYVDVLPGFTLATTNLVSFFGLHRRWRGALVGHLAVFEMTSVEPMGRYSLALRRLGFGPVARHFYEVHVVADAHHEQVAAHQLAASLAAQDPRMVADILLGARAIMAVEGNFSANLMAAWTAGRSALLRPVEALGVAAVA
jgi:heme oxygenase-like protein